jgi:hypothetical protein
MTKSAIFKAAWSKAKAASKAHGGKSRDYFPASLKAVYAELKAEKNASGFTCNKPSRKFRPVKAPINHPYYKTSGKIWSKTINRIDNKIDTGYCFGGNFLNAYNGTDTKLGRLVLQWGELSYLEGDEIVKENTDKALIIVYAVLENKLAKVYERKAPIKGWSRVVREDIAALMDKDFGHMRFDDSKNYETA